VDLYATEAKKSIMKIKRGEFLRVRNKKSSMGFQFFPVTLASSTVSRHPPIAVWFFSHRLEHRFVPSFFSFALQSWVVGAHPASNPFVLVMLEGVFSL
jgi:hypothetical protein